MLEKLKTNYPKILTIGIYLALFTSLLYPYRDKDWGWHYKYGEYFLQNGEFLIRDIYSWSLAGYAWINHSWFFDPLLYILFNRVGYVGLSVSAGLIALLVFYLITVGHKLRYWQLGIAAYFFSNLVETGIREGLRSQVLALLPLGLLMYLLKRGLENPKWFRALPLLFLVWANLHGTFVFGLGILGAFFAVYFFQYPSYRKSLISTGLLSIFATLLSPFNYHSYLEVLRHTSSPYLQNVFEWMPIYYNCADCHVPSFSVYLTVLIVAALIKPQKIELPYFLVALALAWQTISARRYLPLFGATTLPLLASFLSRIKVPALDLGRYALTPYLTAITLVVIIQFHLYNRLPSFNYYSYSEADYCAYASRCPQGALAYLQKNPPLGNGLNFYDWGGYMIGKGFPAKLFVDGRMHLWQVKDYTPFGDYIQMYYHGNQELFKQYDFSWVLVEPDSVIAKMIEEGSVGAWRLLYRDDTSQYYVRVQ